MAGALFKGLGVVSRCKKDGSNPLIGSGDEAKKLVKLAITRSKAGEYEMMMMRGYSRMANYAIVCPTCGHGRADLSETVSLKQRSEALDLWNAMNRA